jgi:diacylglycerol diphosphate phosphatase/phosphatidate phosphatase
MYMVLTGVTGTLKNAIGKPRPDLIDRCNPDPIQMADLLQPLNYNMANHSICRQTNNAILKDGFRSFPSGHSSSMFSSDRHQTGPSLQCTGAWAGLFYLSLYLSGKMHLLDSRGEVWKSFIVLVPSLGAALIAGSRIMDARHHPFDVITGSLLGIFCAWTAYRQYFPTLSDYKAKGRAYPIVSSSRFNIH